MRAENNVLEDCGVSKVMMRRGSWFSFRGYYLPAFGCCLLTCIFPATALSKDPGAVERQPAHLAEAVELTTANVPGGLNNDLRRQLWRALISTPKVQKDEGDTRDLEQLIEQIRSIEFRPQKEVTEPVSGTAGGTVEPNGLQPTAQRSERPEEQGTTFESGCRAVSSRTLSRIKELAEQPAQVENPFELAEVLYLSGATKEAAVFYEEALNRKGAGETLSPQQKSWVMFQAGNCLRHLDMPRAQKFYRRLITDYPDSCWVDLAKVQDKLIEWYLSEKPETLTTEDASKQEQEIAARQGAGA
jgi:hypothetical protein